MEEKIIEENKRGNKIPKQKKRHSKKNFFYFILFLLLLIAVLVIGGYLGKKYLNAKKYQNKYSIDFRDQNFKKTEALLYINEPLFSPKFGVAHRDKNNENYFRQILGSPISFIWHPEEFIGDKKIKISAEIQDKGNWNIALVCRNCPEEKKFLWKQFSCGELVNYKKIAMIDTANIYAKQNFSISSNKSASIEEWLNKNAKKGISIKTDPNLLNKNNFINQIYNDQNLPKDAITTIPNKLRGGSEFYFVINNGELNLTLEKVDLNVYEGVDEIEYFLFDINNNLLEKNTIPDDGNISKIPQETDQPIIQKITKQNLANGIYKLAFAEKDQKNFDDYLLTNIQINSPKIIFNNKNTLFFDAGKIYTEIKETKDLYFYAWHETATQTIKLTSTNAKTIEVPITKEEIGKTVVKTLEPGRYEISFGGDIFITGNYFSPSSESYFEPYLYNFTNDNSSLIITNCTTTKEKNDWLLAEQTFFPEEMDKLGSLNEMEFVIKNESLKSIYDLNSRLTNNNFMPKGFFDSYVLWGLDEPNELSETPTNFSDWIFGILPTSSSLVSNENLSRLEEKNITILNMSPYSYNFGEKVDYILVNQDYGQEIYLKKLEIKVE